MKILERFRRGEEQKPGFEAFFNLVKQKTPSVVVAYPLIVTDSRKSFLMNIYIFETKDGFYYSGERHLISDSQQLEELKKRMAKTAIHRLRRIKAISPDTTTALGRYEDSESESILNTASAFLPEKEYSEMEKSELAGIVPFYID
jgi:hypothetical protein